MKDRYYMTIKEFSNITGIKSQTLRYYDQIGLFSPEHRGENGYRYYTRNQLTTSYLIISLREIGISIDEIKKYIDTRTPQQLFSLFDTQREHILMKIKKLTRIIEIMQLYVDMTKDAVKYKENSINIEYKKKEPIFLSPIVTNNPTNDYINDSIISFYNFATESEINVIGYPSGAIINIQNFESDRSLLVKHYYFKMKDYQSSYKPEGKYVVFYGRCAYGESADFYEKLFAFTKENNLRVCSDAYEEYPLNELTTKDEKYYCVKIEVMVEDI
ncbi:MerR family transcriptional regulator [Romboutsia ilealis]|uniref:MerR family transcriptional regulator n=1 Tax=Romboutsia faecis TaxID=2764597 RepID=A0ABR7JTG2_9FIRM|nr:MerR family transcriptional regulator [Romboutsia faecis]MBC5998208.1 MerR family transcriptional regulator [Romboutsia faecis]MRN25828.1 MerR family transcriptional regulator [Romboutsia ilealis]